MASKHLVTCVECGKRFDANNGGYYNKASRRYTCKSCGKAINAAYKKENAEKQAAEREKNTGMKQSMGAMIAKIAAGALFVIVGFSAPEGGWTFGYFLTCLVVGAALIAWGALPYVNAQKLKKANDHTVGKTNAQETSGEMKVCASCGAAGYGTFCEYCGKKLSE